MSTALLEAPARRRGLLGEAGGDALLVTLALVHGAVLILYPVLPVVALGLWWNSNTISHNFIHRPFFRGSPGARALNLAFSLYLSALLGVPQALWRERHLAHHAGRPCRLRPSLRLGARLALESAAVLGLWAGLLALAPEFFLTVYLPGYLAGLGLAWVHGREEHARGVTSHYGRLYNWLFLNDGYHAEHHARPGLHWSRLPERREPRARSSPWPAPLRWLESLSLEGLERLVLRSRALKRFVLHAHERAFARLLPWVPAPWSGEGARVGIVGGGLFPRTALVLGRLLPEARLTLIDRSAENLDAARAILTGPTGLQRVVEYRHGPYDPAIDRGFDLLVFPLSFEGDHEAIYRDPPAPAVLVHDWIWRRRGRGMVVAFSLLKRVNLVRSGSAQGHRANESQGRKSSEGSAPQSIPGEAGTGPPRKR